MTTVGGPLLFGVRLWASVCLALYVAFWLQLPNADWAGTTAFIVCQPQLGASLRKGWYRLIGTLIGATMSVVFTALFPQDRVAFLGTLAIWGAFSAFAATVLRNFASYAAALAGFTTLIIAADTLGATGGPSADVFMLAVTRASEISIGIVSAGIVLAATDLGNARRALAAQVAALGAEIVGRFVGLLAHARGALPATRGVRRDLTLRIIALDPAIDLALGESSQLRYHSPILQRAYHGLFKAIDGWRCVATRLEQLPPDTARQEVEPILHSLPPEFRQGPQLGAPSHWTDDPQRLQRTCNESIRTLLALPADTPSLRLLADQTARLLAGMMEVLAGLALLVNAPGRPHQRYRGFRLSVPDLLPALVSAARAFLAIAAVELLWAVTAWPNGAIALLFTGVLVLLFSPRGDTAYATAMVFTAGTIVGIVVTAAIKFALLPMFETFAALCAALGLYLVPVGFGTAYFRLPAMLALLTAVGISFVPLLQPSNPMTYDTLQFYNTALALFAGSAAATLAFALLPPPSPELRTRRLLRFALRDVRRCAVSRRVPDVDAWERRTYGRLAALPDQTELQDLSRLLGTLTVGSIVIHLRRLTSVLPLRPELDAALAALAQGNTAIARQWLARLDARLAGPGDAGRQGTRTMRARAGILALSEALAVHASYLDSGEVA
ncbi:MAG TPA: FUSC family protein [Hyphomicrobiaceae bacterium]|nr:FUSC family protein [Hyphomicrobiaceae bacterium]